MPGVAFTESCGRCGHGMGYYDKFLARLIEKSGRDNVKLIAVAFKEQLVPDDELPMDATDVRLDAVITAWFPFFIQKWILGLLYSSIFFTIKSRHTLGKIVGLFSNDARTTANPVMIPSRINNYVSNKKIYKKKVVIFWIFWLGRKFWNCEIFLKILFLCFFFLLFLHFLIKKRNTYLQIKYSELSFTYIYNF